MGRVQCMQLVTAGLLKAIGCHLIEIDGPLEAEQGATSVMHSALLVPTLPTQVA